MYVFLPLAHLLLPPLITSKVGQAEWNGLELKMAQGLPSSGPPKAAPFFCSSWKTKRKRRLLWEVQGLPLEHG